MLGTPTDEMGDPNKNQQSTPPQQKKRRAWDVSISQEVQDTQTNTTRTADYEYEDIPKLVKQDIKKYNQTIKKDRLNVDTKQEKDVYRGELVYRSNLHNCKIILEHLLHQHVLENNVFEYLIPAVTESEYGKLSESVLCYNSMSMYEGTTSTMMPSSICNELNEPKQPEGYPTHLASADLSNYENAHS